MSIRFLSKFGAKRGTYDISRRETASNNTVRPLLRDDLESGQPTVSTAPFNVTLARKKNNRDEFPSTVDYAADLGPDPDGNSPKRCLCILIGAALVAAVIILFALILLSRPILEESLLACKPHGDNITDVSSYVDYLKNKSSRVENSLCDGFSLFVRHSRSIWDLNNDGSAQFGYTYFTDVDLDKYAAEDPTPNFNRSDFPRDIPNRNITRWNITYSDAIDPDDTCSLTWRLRNVLTQCYESLGIEQKYGTHLKRTISIDEICGGEKVLVELREITLPDSPDKIIYQLKQLLQNGPFITKIKVPEAFFHYKSGIFGKRFCNSEEELIPLYAVVYGYGQTADEKSGYWYVKPIGQKFTNWGEMGIVKYECSPACELGPVLYSIE